MQFLASRYDSDMHACYAVYLCARVMEIFDLLPHVVKMVGEKARRISLWYTMVPLIAGITELEVYFVAELLRVYFGSLEKSWSDTGIVAFPKCTAQQPRSDVW